MDTPIIQTLERILTIDNPADMAILRAPAQAVIGADLDLAALAFEMHALMPEHGLALAAPQVGLPYRIIYFDIPGAYLGGARRPFRGIFVNPRITKRTGGTKEETEGCLSIPDRYGVVARDRRITVKMGLPSGQQMTLSCEDRLARVIQHEVDHLDGVLFMDRLAPGAELHTIANIQGVAVV